MIEATNVTVLYRRGPFRKTIKALDRFSLRIEKGDVFGLLGPNGAGKSTAMYCFLGLIRPNQGSVQIFGETPEAGAPLFERVAYLPEEPHYHPYLTVEEALTYYASLYQADIPKTKVQEVTEQVGLTEFNDLRIDRCSKGIKQKVGIAACLLNNPDLIFMDEPTRGLDPFIAKDLRDILRNMNQQGATIVLNSHVLSEVEMICNRVAIMKSGQVIVQDSLKNLLTMDLENYEARFDPTDSVPEYLQVTSRTTDEVTVLLPTDKVQEFFRFAEERKLRIYSCSLKHSTLEEVFFNVLKRNP